MGNTVIAFAASALTSAAATSALDVRERAVTRGDIRGQVCPMPGSTGFSAFTRPGSGLSLTSQQWAGISARYGAEIVANRVMNNVQLSKPRTGYRTTSGTG
jgi:hypothetical protein